MSEMLTANEARQGATVEAVDDFTALLNQQLRLKDDGAKTKVEAAVRTLAEQALADVSLVSDNVKASIEQIIANIDAKLTAQINLILHHEQFQKLEAAWRGLDHLVSRTETDAMLEIRVMPMSKTELRTMMAPYKGSNWDQSPLFKEIYESGFGTLGGKPYGCLVGDYEWSHSGPDVTLLGKIAQVAAAAHCPFISAAAPELLQLDSWSELPNKSDLALVLNNDEYNAWRSLRKNEDSRYVGLAMPRFLARPPFGAKGLPVDAFDFEEDTGAGDQSRFCWSNAAYAMAANITRSFKLYGWCVRIRGEESGGQVEKLPQHIYDRGDGSKQLLCPTEVGITERREAECANLGLMALVHRKNADSATFMGAQSLYLPAKFHNDAVNAAENLSARLPYMFTVCRFSHYLKAMCRDKVGSFASATSMQKYLNDWVSNYVDTRPEYSSEEEKARQPLLEAAVEVTEIEGNPGYYNAKFSFKPHYQLEGVNIQLSLVSKLPAKGNG